MIALISPSKTLSEDPVQLIKSSTTPDFLEESSMLVNKLKKIGPSGLGKLMKINPKISHLNAERYLKWSLPFTDQNARQALLMFKGEVYSGLKAESFDEKDLLFVQDRLRILSGLYGVLRPLDLMQAYRLEMGTQLPIRRKKNLYDFWGSKLTQAIKEEISGHKEKVILNLASDEYFKAIDPSKLEARIVKFQFKEERDGKLKFITIFGKQARGMMVRFMVKERIEEAEDLKTFDWEGYRFNPEFSDQDNWMFSR